MEGVSSGLRQGSDGAWLGSDDTITGSGRLLLDRPVSADGRWRTYRPDGTEILIGPALRVWRSRTPLHGVGRVRGSRRCPVPGR